jgi:hypothetical protein
VVGAEGCGGWLVCGVGSSSSTTTAVGLGGEGIS